MSTPVASEDDSYSDDEYDPSMEVGARYPIHDAVEFQDLEVLRNLIFVPRRRDDDSDVDSDSDSNASDDDSSNSNAEEEDANESKPVSSGEEVTNMSSSNTDAMNISPVKLDVSKTEGSENDMEEEVESNLKDDTAENKKGKKSKKAKEPVYFCPYDLNQRDPDGITPLHVAIHSRKLEHAQMLLEAGASPHLKSDYSAPIHTAISIGSVSAHKTFAFQCVELLHKYNADLTVKDDSSHTPLYLATMYNLPSVASIIINDPIGIQTLNMRSDRKGGRPLHAAAKFDTMKSKTINNGLVGSPEQGTSNLSAIMTKMLLDAPGIEVDAQNNFGRTPLHIAASRGNWQVARLLLSAGANALAKDARGMTPGNLAMKRGIPIPNDIISELCSESIPPLLESCLPPKRDLIIDPEQQTYLICHELCGQHLTCPPINRNSDDTPPENIRRLSVLLDDETGILRGSEFENIQWEGECRRAAIGDVLKIHEYKYVEQISQVCNEIPDHPNAIAHLDSDTGISRWSFEAAMRAAGSVCEAVDRIMAGDFRNAFCAVRPPGHHAGPRGIVKCELDMEGSHGFCLLNNVAIGAAYARCMYRNEGIKKIAIVDFDVHHGNGTEAVIRNLVPNVERTAIRLPFASGSMEAPTYRPWLDETDVDNVFFASAHGYGPRTLVHHMGPHPGYFYPSSGKSYISQSVSGVAATPGLEEFLFTQSWTRMGEEASRGCCKIINVGLSLPTPSDIPGMQRVETRDAYRKNILPRLMEFNPDLIFVSAGFDAHKRDEMNFGYVGMVEEDYEWLTEQLVKVANTCCNGRIVSVLEGGYRIHGGIVSPFARSVASHVRALVDGGNSRELYDRSENEWESQFERDMTEERERKRQIRMERLSRPFANLGHRRQEAQATTRESIPETPAMDMEAIMTMPMSQSEDTEIHGEPNDAVVDADVDEDGQPRKRKRNQVDYKELFEQMKQEEGLA